MTVSGVFAFREWIRKISRDASPHGQEAEQTPTEQKAVQTESPNSEEAFKDFVHFLALCATFKSSPGLVS